MLDILFTFSFNGGNIVEITAYSILYSFLSVLILYRVRARNPRKNARAISPN